VSWSCENSLVHLALSALCLSRVSGVTGGPQRFLFLLSPFLLCELKSSSSSSSSSSCSFNSHLVRIRRGRHKERAPPPRRRRRRQEMEMKMKMKMKMMNPVQLKCMECCNVLPASHPLIFLWPVSLSTHWFSPHSLPWLHHHPP